MICLGRIKRHLAFFAGHEVGFWNSFMSLVQLFGNHGEFADASKKRYNNSI